MVVGIKDSKVILQSNKVAECSCCIPEIYFQNRISEGGGGFDAGPLSALNRGIYSGAYTNRSFKYKYVKTTSTELQSGEVRICEEILERDASYSVPQVTVTLPYAKYTTYERLQPYPQGNFTYSDSCRNINSSGTFDVTENGLHRGGLGCTNTNTTYSCSFESTHFSTTEITTYNETISGLVPHTGPESWAYSNYGSSAATPYNITTYPFGFSPYARVRTYADVDINPVFYRVEVGVSGTRFFRLVVRAVKLKGDPYGDDSYGPSSKNYLKIFLRKKVTTYSWSINSNGIQSEEYLEEPFTVVLSGERTKGELLGENFYTSDEISFPFTGGPITPSGSSDYYRERYEDITVIGTTTNKDHQGNMPP